MAASHLCFQDWVKRKGRTIWNTFTKEYHKKPYFSNEIYFSRKAFRLSQLTQRFFGFRASGLLQRKCRMLADAFGLIA